MYLDMGLLLTAMICQNLYSLWVKSTYVLDLDQDALDMRKKV